MKSENKVKAMMAVSVSWVLGGSSVARALPGHPENQIEEENDEKLKEKKEKIIGEWGEMRKCDCLSCPPEVESLASMGPTAATIGWE